MEPSGGVDKPGTFNKRKTNHSAIGGGSERSVGRRTGLWDQGAILPPIIHVGHKPTHAHLSSEGGANATARPYRLRRSDSSCKRSAVRLNPETIPVSGFLLFAGQALSN